MASLEGSGLSSVFAGVVTDGGAHGNAGMGVVSSPLTTPVPAQEAAAAPASTLAVYPKETDAKLEACPLPVVIPPPATPPTAALKLGPACQHLLT